MLTIDSFDASWVVISGKPLELFELKARVSAARPNANIISPGVGKVQLSREDFEWVAPYCEDLVLVPSDLAESSEDVSILFERHEAARQVFYKQLESGSSAVSPYWESVLQEHQAAAVTALATPGLLGMCIFDEQGTGKTLTTVAAFDTLLANESVDAMFVVAPKTLVGTWMREFEEFLPGKYSVQEVAGNKAHRLASLYKSADVFVATYETVSTDSTLISSLLGSKKFLLVFDESFLVKNPDAQRSRGALAIRRSATIALVLCGTPAPNSASDLVHQFNIADMGFTFRGAAFDGSDSEAARIQGAVDARGTYIRRLKSEVLPDLARKSHLIHEFDLNQTQRDLYEVAKNELELYLRRIDNKIFKRSLATYFQKRAALLQICISPSLIGAHTVDSAKYSTLMNLAGQILASDGKKIVVWSSYNTSTDHLMQLFADFNPVKIDGSVSQEERQLAITSFQENPKVRVFIGNPAAAGAGITLTAASDAIFVSLPTQAAFYMQSLDRIHRIGQEANEVRYHFLIARNTIEKRELERLSQKQSVQGELFHDRAADGLTLEEALEELNG